MIVANDATRGIQQGVWNFKFSKMNLATISPQTANRYAYALISFLFVITVAAAFSLKKLDTQYSFHQFNPSEHPLFKNDDKVKRVFAMDEELPVLVTLRLKSDAPGTWLDPQRIALIREAGEDIAKVQGVRNVTSIGNFESAVSSEAGIRVGNIFSLVPEQEWKNRVLQDPLIMPGLVSSDLRTVMILGDIGVIPTDDARRIDTEIRKTLANRFSSDTAVSKSRGVEALLGGIVPLQTDMAGLITKELHRFLVLAFLACVVTLIAYFRSFSSIVICLILVVISNIGALSGMALTGVAFSVLSTSLPILASITALSIGSHTLLNLSDQWRAGPPRSKLTTVLKVYHMLFLPNFLTALTTSVGFATLAWSTVPLIRQFAVSVSCGIMISWLLISIALPPLMYLFPIPEARRWTASKARWALWVIQARSWIVGAVVLGVLSIGLYGVRLNWAVHLFDDLPRVGEVKASADLIDGTMGGMIPLEVMIQCPASEPECAQDPWNSPDRIAKLGAILSHWRTNPSVGSAVGVPDFLNAGKSLVVGNSRQAIAETLFLYSMAESNPLPHYLTADGSATRLTFRFKDVSALEMEKVVSGILNDVKHEFPKMELTTGGPAVMVHAINGELSRQLISGLWQSLLCISILMVIVFRSLRWSLVCAVPNLLAPLALIATMALLHTPIKPTVAIIFSIALGVAYNNTVYVMARLKWLAESSTRPTLDYRRSIDRAWYQEANPCLFSSIALFGGFAVFLSSYFSLNRVFGAYMLWSIGVGLFGDLIFLPALLRLFPSLLLGVPARRVINKTEKKSDFETNPSKLSYTYVSAVNSIEGTSHE